MAGFYGSGKKCRILGITGRILVLTYCLWNGICGSDISFLLELKHRSLITTREDASQTCGSFL